jgi:hypothetical protein
MFMGCRDFAEIFARVRCNHCSHEANQASLAVQLAHRRGAHVIRHGNDP